MKKNFSLEGASHRLMNNILNFVEENYLSKKERYNVLCDLLGGTIGLTDNEIKEVML